MPVSFKKATKQQARLRMAIVGPSGSGKTYTSLNIARELGERVAVIDTERGSASKYASLFDFDVLELESYHPDRYVEAIAAAEQAGYDVVVIDSLSHAWNGKDGALEQKDKAAARSRSNDSFGAWRDVTPMHNRLVEAITSARIHVIATMRSKTEYVIEQDHNGKNKPRKIGLAPIQRDGMEYEFDVLGEMDQANTMIVTKSRCSDLNEAVIPHPGADVGQTLKAWLSDGVEVAPKISTAEAAAKYWTDFRIEPDDWQAVEHLLGYAVERPSTVGDWRGLYAATKEAVKQLEAEAAKQQ